MLTCSDIQQALQAKLGNVPVRPQATRDGIPTFWVRVEEARRALQFLKSDVEQWYRAVWDTFGITFGGHPYLSRILMSPKRNRPN